MNVRLGTRANTPEFISTTLRKTTVNLTGQKFGQLNVISFAGYSASKRSYWLCMCDCGKYKCVTTQSLRSGEACKCNTCAQSSLKDVLTSNGTTIKLHKSTKDLTGMTIGKWFVISFAGYKLMSGQRVACWLCRCWCDREFEVLANSLISGDSTACAKCQNRRILDTEHVASAYFMTLESGAKRRDIDFTITIDDLEQLWQNQNGICALSGIPLIPSAGLSKNNLKESNASVDRIYVKTGYIDLSNLQYIHKTLNFMKQTLSNVELRKWCHLITDNDRKKKHV